LHHVIIAVEKATGPPPLGATGKINVCEYYKINFV
jgi:hypothetical protein